MNAFQCPEGFLWGAATSAHQVEGNNVHSDWWAWEQAGRVNDRSGLARDPHPPLEQGFDLPPPLNHNPPPPGGFPPPPPPPTTPPPVSRSKGPASSRPRASGTMRRWPTTSLLCRP